MPKNSVFGTPNRLTQACRNANAIVSVDVFCMGIASGHLVHLSMHVRMLCDGCRWCIVR
uniref:Uncharacterized protein n=1 Tax=Trichuris muris TaxID=70415 RepID=A0A5S6R0K6_TRIMR